MDRVAIDFVIVVVGDFVGIEVANRNPERINAERQDGLLRERVVGLRADIDGIDGVMEATALRYNAAEALVSRVTGRRMRSFPECYAPRCRSEGVVAWHGP